jgi:hypothetical protein
MDAPAPSLALDAFVQAHEVVMMHEARPQVAAGKNAQIDVRRSTCASPSCARSGSRTNP